MKHNFLEQVYRKNRKYFIYLAFTYVKDNHLAEDIFESVIESACLSQIDFNAFQMANTWIRTAVINKCLNYFEAKKVRKTKCVDDLSRVPIYDDPKKEIIDDVVVKVYATLQTLPPQCQEIIKLFFLKEMEGKEIAEYLNLKHSTVKTQKARGLKLLRERLNFTTEQYNENMNYLLNKIKTSTKSPANISKLYGINPHVVSTILRKDTKTLWAF